MKQVGKSNWYELTDGSKVQGRANAEKAQAELDGGGSELSRYGNPYAAVIGQDSTPPANISRYGNPYAKVVDPEE
jgi:hypothetical protein